MFQSVLRGISARIPLGQKYQDKLQASFDDRWELVRTAFPTTPGSVLDVGSNLGAFTARVANEGHICLGIEREADLVRKARALHSRVKGCGFMEADMDLRFCEQLPTFDVTLLLSVHHHWHHAFGAAAAAHMLRSIVEKSRTAVVFEGPSRSSRYESNIPDFADNDEEALLAYYDRYLQETVGDLASDVKRVGKAACVGQREPYRWIYAIVR